MNNSVDKRSIRNAVSSSQRQHLDQSENCEQCLTETDISRLNLATGLCNACSKSDKKKMRELLKDCLEVDYDTIFSKK